MPRHLSTPPQTPVGGFPVKGSDAQVSPATGPKGMPTGLVGGCRALHAGIFNWASPFPTLPSRTLQTLNSMDWG